MSLPNLVPRGDNTGSLGTASKRWSTIYAYNLDSSTPQSGIFSGSFSGSFQGDGTGLTGITATAVLPSDVVSGSAQISYNGITDVPSGIVSSSAQIASDISGSFNNTSGSLSTRVTTLESAGSINTGSFATTGSNVFIGNQYISGDTVITGSVTVSGSNSIVNLQELQFDIGHTPTGHSTGRMYWDDTNKTATLDMQGSDVRLQMGQESHVYAKNTSGVTINNGDAVRISGAAGANLTIEKAVSKIKSFKDSTEANEILGLATEQILNNQSGYVTTFGGVGDLDTSGFSAGDLLYLSNTTSGSYTNVKPIAPYFEAKVGVVKVSNNGAGVIISRPQEPVFLTDIAQVTSSGIIPNEITYLCYDDSTDLISFTNEFSGSFSGSFQGNGTGLTNLTLTSYGLISGSAQIATEISGAYNETSSSLAERITNQESFSSSLDVTFWSEAEQSTYSSSISTRLTTDETNINTNTNALATLNGLTLVSGSSQISYNGITDVPIGILSGSTQIADDISGSFTSVSSSLSGRIASQESFSSSLDTNFWSETEQVVYSASLSTRFTTNETNITNLQTDSGSFSTRVTGNESAITNLQTDSSSFSTRTTTLENNDTSQDTLISNLTSATSSYVVTNLTDSDTQNINGSLKLTGNIIAENYIISSSVTYMTQSFSSGSTIFGDTQDDTHQFTGSIYTTGSITAIDYYGNGGNLTGITADSASYVEYSNIVNKPTLLSGSAQIATEISGAFTHDSSSFSTRISSQENFSSSLDTTFWSEAEQSVYSASLSTRFTTNEVAITNLQTDSGSFSTRVTTLETATVYSGSFSGSFEGNGSGITNIVSSSYSVTASHATSVAVDSVDIEDLSATGTANGSTFLRGDGSWATPAGSGDVSKVGTPVNDQLGIWTGDGTIEGNSGLTYNGTDLNVTNAVSASQFSGSFNGDGSGLTNVTATTPSTTRITSSTYTVLSTDYRIGIAYSLTGSSNIQLPLVSAVPNIEFKFKDEEGNALVNAQHIIASGSDVIDGAPTASLGGNYHGFSIYNNGINKWFVE